MKIKGNILLVTIGLFLFACQQIENKHKRVSSHAHYSYRNIITSLKKAQLNLHDGDLVLRRGKDFTSYMFSQLNLHDKTFSHCGIVIVENGNPYVYHAIGGEENPNQELKREPAKTWFSYMTNQTVGIARFDLSDDEKKKLKVIVLNAYASKKKFDNQFSLATNDCYYCSEFVYKTMNAVFGNDTVFSLVNKFGRTFIPVENLYHNSRAKLVWQVTYK